MKKLLVFGAGQYSHVAKEIALAIGEFEKVDFLDDNAEIAIGKLCEFEKFLSQYDCAIVAIGNAKVRIEYLEKLEQRIEIATLISPKAFVSESARVERGCIVEPMAVVNANAVIKKGTFVSAGAVVNHNAEVGVCCHVDCGAVVLARSVVCDFEKIKSLTAV